MNVVITKAGRTIATSQKAFDTTLRDNGWVLASDTHEAKSPTKAAAKAAKGGE